MYTLRKVIDGIQHNEEIGKSYQVIERISNYEKFSEVFENVFGTKHVADMDSESTDSTKTCYMFLVLKDSIIPLFKDEANYIMNENGKTFSNLTFK